MQHDTARRNARFPHALACFALALALTPFCASAATPESLTAAHDSATGCLPKNTGQGHKPPVTVLTIGTGSPCTAVTISAADASNFSADNPLPPVLIGPGGTLTLEDPGPGNSMTLYASSFLIKGGAMLAGTPTTRVAGQIDIVMAGHASAAPPPTHGDTNPNMRDITVMDGGVLALYGAKGISGAGDFNTFYGTNSWTYLSIPAGPAGYDDAANVSAPVPAPTSSTSPQTTLTLARIVDWKTNDWISVATTSFSSHQTEIVQVCANTPVANPDTGGAPAPPMVSQITLCAQTPLKHYHYGGLAPTPGFFPAGTVQPVIAGGKAIDVSHQARSFYDNATRNYGIDERAEVALLSRNIKLTSVAGNQPVGGIAGASNTDPIVITVPIGATVPPNGEQVTVSAVAGITAANGTWTVASSTPGNATTPGTFALQNANGASGTAFIAGSGTFTTQAFLGGHLVAMVSSPSKPAPTLQLVGVEIEKFGQPLVGRYPVHLHHLPQNQITGAATSANDSNIVISSANVPPNGVQVAVTGVQGNGAANGTWTVANANPTAGTFELAGSTGNGTYTSGGMWAALLIKDVSVHHGYNKCFTVHGTADANFFNNSCVRTVGQGFYLEDGAGITGNQFIRNHVAGTMAAQSSYSYPQQIGSQYWDGDNLLLSHWPTGTISNVANGGPIVVTSAAVPANGSQVTITGAQGNTAANGNWTVINAHAAAGTFGLAANGNGNYTSGGSFPAGDGTIIGTTAATATSPIVVTSTSVPANGAAVTISGTGTPADSSIPWIVENPDPAAGTFALQGSKATGSNGYSPPTWSISELNSITSLTRDKKSGLVTVNTQSPAPLSGQVTISYTDTTNRCSALNGTWKTTNRIPGPPSFDLVGSQSVNFGKTNCAGGTWSASGSIAAIASNVVTVTPGAAVPAGGDFVTISGPPGSAGPKGGWLVTSSGPGTFTLGGSPSVPKFTSPTWQASSIVTNVTNNTPMVVSASIVPPNGTVITISDVKGNTAAIGTWAVANAQAKAGTFALAPVGNGSYTGGASWQSPQASTNWYTVNSIPDSSLSGLNNAQVDSQFPGGFWITNLANTFANNSVAGCQARGRGYWLLAESKTSPDVPIMSNVLYGYPEFSGNRVHACMNGIDDDDVSSNTQGAMPMLSGTGAGFAPVFLINDSTVTRSRKNGLWMRSIYTTLHNDRFAANLHGFSLLVGGGPEGTFPGYWGLVHENVIAGMTRNNVERYPACPQTGTLWQQECTDVTLGAGSSWGDYPDPNMNILGYSYYDGPARIEHNRFVNFRYDPTGIYPNDQAARLLTTTDINTIKAVGPQGQLAGPPSINGSATSLFNGYVGDAATGWQQSNAQTVPPTQYIRDSIWDNVDFKHQVYTEDVNLGPLNDGDKSTVIKDKDSQLSGLRVVDGNGNPVQDAFPISLNNLDYYATDYTVDESHARGPNNFRASALMSPHKYATLNIESVINPTGSATPPLTVEIKRDMPAYDDATYPSLFLYGRGGQPIYEPFLMDRMGYSIYGKSGLEHKSPLPAAFNNRLLLSYTDPAVHKGGDFFVNRIALYQPVANQASIQVYRTRRKWGGQLYGNTTYPPNFNGPGGAGSTCDNVFNQNQGVAAENKWTDCIARATNLPPYNQAPYTNLGYPYGIALQPAATWTAFEQNYKNLLAGQTPGGAPFTVQNFIQGQTYYYDTTSNMLYFYMIEDSPVQRLPSPYGTCGGGAAQYAANVALTQQIKRYSHAGSVQAALDASCLAGGGTWQLPDSPQTPITGASNDGNSPIVITSAASPTPGARVTISGVTGNTAANGTWSVTILDSHRFSLNNSIASAAYISGGTWTQAYPIMNATNTSPITITTSAPVPANGTAVSVAGVVGNTSANNTGANSTWTVANANPATGSFELAQSTGNGAFVKYDPQPNDLFICGQIGCAAYLVDFDANPVTAASNASPIVITTTSKVPANDASVTIAGVGGNTGANGNWTVADANPTAGTFALSTAKGKGAYTSGGVWNIVPGQGNSAPPACSPCTPKHPISRSDYRAVNQYQLVYGTPAQQPNGLPSSGNPAAGNDAPPPDGTPLAGAMVPVSGVAPPTGDQVTYYYRPLQGTLKPLGENFPYRCLTTPPWSPVNARGAYPPSGGFASPLHDSVCDWELPHAIAAVANTAAGSGTKATTTITGNTNTSNTLSIPGAGTQVAVAGVAGLAKPAYTVVSATANSFTINATATLPYAGGGTWQPLNAIASVTGSGGKLTITVPLGAPVPASGSSVTLTQPTGCTVTPNASRIVTSAVPGTATAGGTLTIAAKIKGTCAANTGTWQLATQ